MNDTVKDTLARIAGIAMAVAGFAFLRVWADHGPPGFPFWSFLVVVFFSLGPMGAGIALAIVGKDIFRDDGTRPYDGFDSPY